MTRNYSVLSKLSDKEHDVIFLTTVTVKITMVKASSPNYKGLNKSLNFEIPVVIRF
jgi:hypothetical protein